MPQGTADDAEKDKPVELVGDDVFWQAARIAARWYRRPTRCNDPH